MPLQPQVPYLSTTYDAVYYPSIKEGSFMTTTYVCDVIIPPYEVKTNLEEIQNYLLALLQIAKQKDVRLTAYRIHVIFFLLQNEKGIRMGLNFKPDIFGPSSDVLDNIIKDLVEEGKVISVYEDLIEPFANTKIGYARVYELKTHVDISIEDEIKKFFDEWIDKRLNEILKFLSMKYKSYVLPL